MNKKSSLIKSIVAGAVFVLLFFGLVYVIEKDKTNKPLEKVKVQAGWLLNGEFANICSSIVEGYYNDEGMEVELIPGGPSAGSFVIATNSVAQNPDITIGVDGDMVPLLRGKTKENQTEQLRVKAFASFWNEVPLGFIVREDSELHSLKDFTKRKPDGSKYKIGVTADSVIPNAIADYAGVNVSDLEIVIVGYDASSFLANQVDALQAFWTTQAYEVEKAGIKYRFLGTNELPGFSQPSQVAIASEKTIKEKPELLLKWLRATDKGTKFVINNPDKAAEQITDNRCGGSNFDVVQEAWLIKKSIPLFNKEKSSWINGQQVSGFAKAYYTLKQIPRIPSENELIDFSIIKRLY